MPSGYSKRPQTEGDSGRYFDDFLRRTACTHPLETNSFIQKTMTFTEFSELFRLFGQHWFEVVELPPTFPGHRSGWIVQCHVLKVYEFWRREAESNRRYGFCRPMPYHLATAPRLVLTANDNVRGLLWLTTNSGRPEGRPLQVAGALTGPLHSGNENLKLPASRRGATRRSGTPGQPRERLRSGSRWVQRPKKKNPSTRLSGDGFELRSG
jgi:hypothetical protein